jgi:ribosomal protein L37AE/L43A
MSEYNLNIWGKIVNVTEYGDWELIFSSIGDVFICPKCDMPHARPDHGCEYTCYKCNAKFEFVGAVCKPILETKSEIKKAFTEQIIKG